MTGRAETIESRGPRVTGHRYDVPVSNPPAPPTDRGAADANPLGGVRSTYRGPRAEISRDPALSWWRRILPIIASHRATFVASIVLSFASLIFQTLVPNLLNGAITNALAHHTTTLDRVVIEIIALGVLAGVSGILSRHYLYCTAYEVEADLRSLIYEHLTWLSFSFYDRVQSGQLISRANSDIRSVQMYSTFAPLIVVQACIGVLAFGFMLKIDPLLACIAMVVMPILYVVGIKMRRVLFPISWITQARLADVATIVDENVNGVRVVKAFAQEEAEINRLADAAERLAWAYVKDARIRGQWSPWVQNLPQLGLALVLAFGGYMVIHGTLGVGAILAFNAYLLMLQAPFMMLGQLVMMGQRAKASAERIFEILDEHPEVVERPGAYDLVEVGGALDFDHVRFGYGAGLEVLSDFDLHLEAGETVALVGRTGAGKSTVARLVTRFYDVDGGAVRIDAHDVRDVTLDSLRQNVGVVLDEPFLFSVSVHENIAYGLPHASRDAVEAAARAAAAHDFITALPDGYDTVVGERGYTLSGGQRQRIAIARTLLVNPPILILDDATSAIDVHVESAIHRALGALMASRTTIIIAHRISTIALARRVIVLDEGRVVADGTHQELLENSPLYAEILAQTMAQEG
ncbi:MAG: ABC transporter ATP-binding protein [Acidobacteriota bacterium]|nr:ABC transporter ATP-binding protein [Acidobacteriota bacterium]MDE3147368.1 ABC transporter ATP-binding protein [Acidobacteriota bacterium]